jgi:hypothetical protein
MRSEGGGKFELTLRSIATLTPYRYCAFKNIRGLSPIVLENNYVDQFIDQIGFGQETAQAKDGEMQ